MSSQRLSSRIFSGLADLTGNGLVDILVAGVDSYQVWRGEGNGRFTADPAAKYRE